jgi:hypothetical protein
MTTETLINNTRWTYFVWAWEAIGKAIATPYSVTIWGSHPDDDNDDCHTGEDFTTIEAASAAYLDIDGVLLADEPGTTLPRATYYAGWAFAMLEGPNGLRLIKKNPDQRAVRAHRRELARSDREWQSERAMQAGMAFGCDGYNDEMGY